MNAVNKANLFLKRDAENKKQGSITCLLESNVETLQNLEEQLIKIKGLNNDIITTSIHLGEHREYARKDFSCSLRVNNSFLTKRISFLSQK